MRQHLGYFTMGGLKWNCFIDNEKTKAGERLYILDKDQLEISVGDESKGFPASRDKIIEHLIRGIVSMALTLIGEKEIAKDEYLSPFGTLLYQFIKTDTFNGMNGSFYLGGTCWIVVNDKTYTFHREVNGECDSNIGRIVLELYDAETFKSRTIEYIRHIYIHEVLHAILCQMGYKHEEKFVQVKGLLLYEILASLAIIENGKEVKMWPQKEPAPIKPIIVTPSKLSIRYKKKK